MVLIPVHNVRRGPLAGQVVPRLGEYVGIYIYFYPHTVPPRLLGRMVSQPSDGLISIVIHYLRCSQRRISGD